MGELTSRISNARSSSLPPCDAMSSTDFGTSLRACYFMSSTDFAKYLLRACFAMSRTDKAGGGICVKNLSY